ncbi:MAG: RNB domain-containing ribonuclease [Deltaproteobacteria bacterium]
MTAEVTRTVTGRVHVHPRGFGFVSVTETDGAITSAFVPPPVLNPFLAGDEVSAVFVTADDGRVSAQDLRLVKRTRARLFGEVVVRKGTPFLKVDREVANTDWPLVVARGTKVTAGAHAVGRVDGDTVVLEKIVPPASDASLERVIARHNLRDEVPPPALEDVRRARAVSHEIGHRRDLREVPTVTVDAPTTRDIDDAIAVLPADADGAMRLLVSIADASEAIPEGCALDLDARDRATSVYLAGRVLPMIPDGLSAEWLSLLPGEDRRCLTVEMRIDPEGRITAADVYESVIRSWARLNYTEVNAWLEHADVSPAMEPVRATLPWLRTAFARLGVARARRGGVVIESDEAKVIVDPVTGEPQSIETVRSNAAHMLIERFMVAANEAIGADGAETDATYYRDTVHLTAAGYAIVAGVVADAVERLL